MKVADNASHQLLSQEYMKSILMENSPLEILHARRAHVDASNLTKNKAPSSLSDHHNLPSPDKLTWDRAYLEEYLGLHEDVKAWEYITEDEYQQLRPIAGTALPSMAVATIKRDEDGKPKRAKYRIVALGNLDPHLWTKTD